MNKKLALALVPFLALALFSLSFNAFSSDEYAYLTTGKAFAQGTTSGYTDLDRFPLYPFTLGALFNVFGYSEVIARLFSILLGAAGIILTFLLARKLAGEETAFWSALLVAVNPFYAYLSTRILTEPLFFALFLASIYALFKAKEWRGYAIFGILTGLTFLTRYLGAYLLLAAGVYAFFWKKSELTIKNSLSVLAGFILALIPWMAWSQNETGNPFGFAINFLKNQLALNETAFSLPDKIPLYALGILILMAAASFALYFALKKQNKKLALLYAAILSAWVSMEAYGLLGNTPLLRYAVPLVPLIAIICVDAVPKGFWFKLLKAAIAVNFILALIVIAFFGSYSKYNGYREAGLYAAEHCTTIDSNIQRIIEHYSGKRNTLNAECIVESSFDGKIEIPSGYYLVFQSKGVNVYEKT
ncbi:MAG: glycosyltransferase family 39 protein [Candidatus Micrarchaeota archaeon]